MLNRIRKQDVGVEYSHCSILTFFEQECLLWLFCPSLTLYTAVCDWKIICVSSSQLLESKEAAPEELDLRSFTHIEPDTGYETLDSKPDAIIGVRIWSPWM